MSITLEYDPELVVGEWGWLWLPTIMAEGGEWLLCRTVHGDDADAEIVISICILEDFVTKPAHTLRGKPYLPLLSPTCDPDEAERTKAAVLAACQSSESDA